MKHLKRFENFGRFGNEEKDNELENDFDNNEFDNFDSGIETDEVCDVCGITECGYDHGTDEREDEEETEEDNRVRRWGDEEIVEKKKVNAGFQAYLDKQKEKNSKKDKKEDKEDKDKEDKKENKKGLTTILKRQK